MCRRSSVEEGGVGVSGVDGRERAFRMALLLLAAKLGADMIELR